MKIITNNPWRNLSYGYEMPEALRSDFDYIAPEDFDSHDFVVYRGHWYDIGEFTRCDQTPGWDGYIGDSFFSGVLIRLSRDGERAIMGLALS